MGAMIKGFSKNEQTVREMFKEIYIQKAAAKNYTRVNTMSIVVHMINLGHGEAILLEFEKKCKDNKISENGSGEIEAVKETFHILIDAGSEKNSRYKDEEGKTQQVSFESLKNKLSNLKCHINGIIITHVDDDHIGGFIKIFGNMYDNVKDYMNLVFVLFNDFDQHKIGFRQANTLSRMLYKKLKDTDTTILKSYQENYIIKNAKINQMVETDGELLPIKFYDLQSRKSLKKIEECIIHITLLYPSATDTKVNGLMQKWKKYNEEPKSKNDKSEKLKNENSIAVLIEYEQCKMVFGGDGYLENIIRSLEELTNSPEKVLQIDVMKLLHHGAIENNNGILEFIKKYHCKKIFYSTNSINYKEHPHIKMICNILKEFPSIEIYATNRIPEEIWNIQCKELQDIKKIFEDILVMDFNWVKEKNISSKEESFQIKDCIDETKIKKIILEYLNERIKRSEDFENGIFIR